jgi:hypothetical protein
VITFWICGANFGGPTITHAPAASNSSPVPLSVTCAVTGPSETSSYQPGLSRKLVMSLLPGETAVPKPPSTSRCPSSSVRASPSGTVTGARPGKPIRPVSNSWRWSGPVRVRAPGSIVRSAALPPALRVIAFRLATCTVHSMFASPAVSSVTVSSSW